MAAKFGNSFSNTFSEEGNVIHPHAGMTLPSGKHTPICYNNYAATFNNSNSITDARSKVGYTKNERYFQSKFEENGTRKISHNLDNNRQDDVNTESRQIQTVKRANYREREHERKYGSVGHLNLDYYPEDSSSKSRSLMLQNKIFPADNVSDINDGTRPKEYTRTCIKPDSIQDTVYDTKNGRYKHTATNVNINGYANMEIPSDTHIINNDEFTERDDNPKENSATCQQFRRSNDNIEAKKTKIRRKRYMRDETKIKDTTSSCIDLSFGANYKDDYVGINKDRALDRRSGLSNDVHRRIVNKEVAIAPLSNVHIDNNESKKDSSHRRHSSNLQSKINEGDLRTQQKRTARYEKSVSIKPSDNYSNVKNVDLFVVLYDNVKDKTKLKDFLTLRMGKPVALDFDIAAEETLELENGGLLVRMIFSSHNKLLVAKHKLTCNNIKTTNKIYCFCDKNETLGQTLTVQQSRESNVEKILEEMLEKTQEVLNKHVEKINTNQNSILEVRSRMMSKKGHLLHDYNKLENEKHALNDKHEELNNQKNEFIRYIYAMKEKLKEIIYENKFDSLIRDIRKMFGVECQRLNNALPMYSRREDILSVVRDNQVCVILGETGSGKSTQMVQYLYQAGISKIGMIACTQPRKVAAITLASRVSIELATSVGQLVGYRVGMQSKKSAETKIMYMTDHILLNECLNDRDLRQYSCIIIDEAHERSIYTDLLLGMIKKCLTRRPELKVIITSATIDPAIFVQFFGGEKQCPVLKVSGKAFPVDIVWDSDQDNDRPFPEDYEKKALDKAIDIHTNRNIEDGDILVFLTSGAETENCVEKFKRRIKSNDYQCLQLHGKLKPEEQQRVIEPSHYGCRKVVFATNCAETSITIPGIKFVIDTGVVKEMRFDHNKNMNSLNVVSASQSSANQRKGRAGRTAAGICYRLYTEEDFNKMEKCGNPEILRIQVSQAMLKLMDLDVDPMSFDYVESPAPEAMKAALCELEEFGAVKNNIITELGKWISKMPIEPKLGVFIKKGIDLGIPVESIVVACCCNQSGIFFRAGSPEEKTTADFKKLKFCHAGGDLLSMLNVYREWDGVNEKKKGNWCLTNSINGKAIRGVRDAVNEIKVILLKEHNLKIKHEFQDPTNADILVTKVIFQCMMSNLCCYLGHESAGYLIINRLQRVQFHPSSALLALGDTPTWAVFNRVLKTSSDFITEVTPVTQEMIDQAVMEKKITLDEASLESMKVRKVFRKAVGKHIFWKFVGPMHKNRRELEESLSKECNNSLVIIEAIKQNRCEISLYCIPEYTESATSSLNEILSKMPEPLLHESKEEPLGNPRSGIRALLRTGGSVVDILMPHQFRALNIKINQRITLSEPKIMDKLSSYGPVEQIWRPSGKKSNNDIIWGKVTFTHECDAVVAMENINKIVGNDFTLEPIVFDSQRTRPKAEYTMKLSWCRRPGKGHAFIYLDRPEDKAKLLSSTRITINEKYVSLSNSRQQSDLFLNGLGLDDSEEDVLAGLAVCLNIHPRTAKNRFRVIIPRQNTTYSSNEIQLVHTLLSDIISCYVSEHSFRLTVKEYKEKTVMASAFVHFTDPDECIGVSKRIRENQNYVLGHPLIVNTEYKSNVHVNKQLYEVLCKEIEKTIEKYGRRTSPTLLLRKLKSGHFSLDITAQSPKKLAKYKFRLDKLVDGDTLECSAENNLSSVFSRDGRQKIQHIEQTTKTFITVDERQMKVVIQGAPNNRARAGVMLWEYVQKNAAVSEIEMCLKSEEKPRGLMKALYIRYGTGFKELKADAGLHNIRINFRRHTLTLAGNTETVAKAVQIIDSVTDELAKCNNPVLDTTDLPNCPICLCTVDDIEVCQLEYCGHAYCKPCLTNMLESTITNKDFPITCAAADCDKPLVTRDINMQIKLCAVKKDELVAAAVNNFVTQNNANFRYCITPDCPIVYRVTKTSERFVCVHCTKAICTACHISFHDGMTCAMYKSAQRSGDSVMNWLMEKPKLRKLCPKCEVGIEKVEGCNHVTCRCEAHICWVCLEYFATCSECYGHLNKEHGSFV